ncbi:hypothetical protein TWF970_007604 [Orbilia oligospora]|uniref:Uncharacterized protein n=1 Tax=Orbilia oligospora TaxID=2813651 RepID=A0A7C8VDM5_ORBOL|nr:hypothetical protein TWF970_007604 [Orbilia oligospora]
MVPPILTPTSSEPRNQVYLPYKYVIFKNTFPDGDWDQGNCFAFDIPSVPFLKSSNDYDNNNTDDNPPLERDTIGLLPEFCQAALSALQSYISTLNSDTDETPDKCKWVIHTVDIGKDEHGVVSGLILFLLNRADSLRAGAGLPTSPPIRAPVNNEPREIIEEEEEGEGETEDVNEGALGAEDFGEDVDVDGLLAEAGGAGGDDGEEQVEAGPANAGGVPRQPRNRGIVGKKKARNLEMRDRRRAYSEFLQSQARERREREEALENDLEETIFAEKQRRALAEIKIEKAKLKEKEERREQEEKNRTYINKLRECISSIETQGTGKISLRSLGHRVGKDEAWIRKTLADEKGLEGLKGGVLSLVTEDGWFIRVGKEEIDTIARRVEGKGKVVEWEEVSAALEDSLKRL